MELCKDAKDSRVFRMYRQRVGTVARCIIPEALRIRTLYPLLPPRLIGCRISFHSHRLNLLASSAFDPAQSV